MADDKLKRKSHQQGVTKNTELINIRFYENQKRQSLLTTTVGDSKKDDDDDFRLSSEAGEVTTTQHHQDICDTADKLMMINSSLCSEAAVSVDSSSVAFSAPSDKSRKGSVDQKIWNLVNLINRETDTFFTTSSCSGRIILYTWDVPDGDGSQSSIPSAAVPSSSLSKLKKGCKWLLVSHDEVEPEELVTAYLTTASSSSSSSSSAFPDDGTAASASPAAGERDVYFKMEPCILHVQCRTLSNARKLIHLATESGFRNSGMVVGKENRITVAIRSAMGLEVPLPPPTTSSMTSSSCQRTDSPDDSSPGLNISDKYLKYLADTANAKMRENWARSEKLTKLFAETAWTL